MTPVDTADTGAVAATAEHDSPANRRGNDDDQVDVDSSEGVVRFLELKLVVSRLYCVDFTQAGTGKPLVVLGDDRESL